MIPRLFAIDGLNLQTPSRDIVFRDQGERRGVFSLVVDQENAVKNLHGLVGVEGRADFSDPVKVTINELE